MKPRALQPAATHHPDRERVRSTAGWWLSSSGLPGGSDTAIVVPADIPIPTARPPLPRAALPTATSAPPSTARTPPLAATPAQRGTVTGCAAQAEPHGTDDPAAWRPAPLPWSAPCARPPGSPAWRPATSLVTASPDTDPPIRLVARPEILPGGEPADPNTDPPADTLDRVPGPLRGVGSLARGRPGRRSRRRPSPDRGRRRLRRRRTVHQALHPPGDSPRGRRRL